jgi:hypothetical protein
LSRFKSQKTYISKVLHSNSYSTWKSIFILNIMHWSLKSKQKHCEIQNENLKFLLWLLFVFCQLFLDVNFIFWRKKHYLIFHPNLFSYNLYYFKNTYSNFFICTQAIPKRFFFLIFPNCYIIHNFWVPCKKYPNLDEENSRKNTVISTSSW